MTGWVPALAAIWQFQEHGVQWGSPALRRLSEGRYAPGGLLASRFSISLAGQPEPSMAAALGTPLAGIGKILTRCGAQRLGHLSKSHPCAFSWDDGAGLSMIRRVALFVDYENAYRNARDLFRNGAHGANRTDGHFRPWQLGLSICRQYNRLHPREDPVELDAVRVYRGQPDRRRDPRGYAVSRAQSSQWEASGCQVFHQVLAYNNDGTQEEKEIDVWLAVDLVAMSIERAFEIAILFSADRDFRPALRYVRDRTSVRVDVAAWGLRSDRLFLSIEGQSPYVHWVGESQYVDVSDPVDYRRRRTKRRGRHRRR